MITVCWIIVAICGAFLAFCLWWTRRTCKKQIDDYVELRQWVRLEEMVDSMHVIAREMDQFFEEWEWETPDQGSVSLDYLRLVEWSRTLREMANNLKYNKNDLRQWASDIKEEI